MDTAPILHTDPEPPERAAQLFAELVAEGDRAHAKHAATSMRAQPWNHHRRMTIFVEELGELARPMNDLEHGDVSLAEALSEARGEAVQLAAMAFDWLVAIDAAADVAADG